MKNIFLLSLSLLLYVNLNAQIKDLPYNGDFDSDAARQGWKEFRTGFQSLSKWSNTGNGFTGRGISHDYNVGGQESEIVQDWYVSPEINFKNLETTMTLKIFSSGFSTPSDDNLLVYYISENQSPSLGDTTLIGNLSVIEHGAWQDTSVTIPAISENGFIAFKYKTKGAAWTTYIIDNIEIKATTAQIKKPVFQGSANAYPTITSEEVILEVSDISTGISYEVYNIQGQLCRRSQIVNSTKTMILKNDLSAGIYYVKIRQNNGSNLTLKIQFTE